MLGAVAGGAIAGGLGNLFSGAMDQIYRWNDNNWQSPLDATKELKQMDFSNSLAILQKQMDYNKMMSSTAYQRAIADLKEAGINPASLAGVSVQQSSSPLASASHSSGAQVITPQKYGSDFFGSSMMNSAVNAAIAKNKSIADVMASELVDNARHAHRLEELREKAALQKQLNKNKDLEHFGKYDYYSEKAEMLRDRYLHK